MQYPIIDLITDAYLNNGWTGLDISSGNLFHVASRINRTIAGVTYTSTDNTIILNGTKYGSGFAFLYELTTTLPAGTYYARAFVLDGSSTNKVNIYVYDGSALTESIVGREEAFTLNDEKTFYIRSAIWQDGAIYDNYTIGIVISDNPGITEFIPYGPKSNDFPNRLKLPLPHYFPHPVIDALQRAAAGTQTADDTEILRHYLTPLGIGGI